MEENPTSVKQLLNDGDSGLPAAAEPKIGEELPTNQQRQRLWVVHMWGIRSDNVDDDEGWSVATKHCGVASGDVASGDETPWHGWWRSRTQVGRVVARVDSLVGKGGEMREGAGEVSDGGE